MTAELPDSDRGSSVNSQRDLGVRAGSTRRGYLAAMCSVSGGARSSLLRLASALLAGALVLAGCSLDTVKVAEPRESDSVMPTPTLDPTPAPTPTPDPSTTSPTPEPTPTSNSAPATWSYDLESAGWTVSDSSSEGFILASNNTGCAVMLVETDESESDRYSSDRAATEARAEIFESAKPDDYTETSRTPRGTETMLGESGGESIEGLGYEYTYEHGDFGSVQAWFWIRVFTSPQTPRVTYVYLQCPQDSYSEDVVNQLKNDAQLAIVGGEPAKLDG